MFDDVTNIKQTIFLTGKAMKEFLQLFFTNSGRIMTRCEDL